MSAAPAAQLAVPRVRPVPGADPEGHVRHGHEPWVRPQDSVERRFVLAYADYLSAWVAAHRGGHTVQRDGWAVHDLGRPSGMFDGATLLQPMPFDGWHDVLDGIEADLVPGGTGEVMLWSAWPTPDLSSRGWRLEGHPPLLLRPAGPAPAVRAMPWLEVTDVDDERTLADWERVVVEGYPFVDCLPLQTGAFASPALLDDPAFHAWVGYEPGASGRRRAVAAGTSYLSHGLDVFALGVTLPEVRGRGAWHELARRRLERFAHVPSASLFSDFSRPPAEGLGFLPLHRWTLWTRPRP